MLTVNRDQVLSGPSNASSAATQSSLIEADYGTQPVDAGPVVSGFALRPVQPDLWLQPVSAAPAVVSGAIRPGAFNTIGTGFRLLSETTFRARGNSAPAGAATESSDGWGNFRLSVNARCADVER